MGDGSDPTLRADDFNWRRLRIGLEGEWRKLVFEPDVDPAFDEGDESRTRGWGCVSRGGSSTDGGHIKLPVSQEWLTSAAKTDVIERAALVDSLAPGRDWGGLIQGESGPRGVQGGGLRGRRPREPQPRRHHRGRPPAAQAVGGFDLGGSFSQGDVSADPVDTGWGPSPKGLSGNERHGLRVLPGCT